MSVTESYFKINIQSHIVEKFILSKSIILIYYKNRNNINYTINHKLTKPISYYFSKQNYVTQDYNLNKNIWQISYTHFYNKFCIIHYNFMYMVWFNNDKICGKTEYRSVLTDTNSLKLKKELFDINIINIGTNYYIPISSILLLSSLATSFIVHKIERQEENIKAYLEQNLANLGSNELLVVWLKSILKKE